MSPLKQDQIYGQNNCSDLGSLSDVQHWSKDWLCPCTRNFPSNTVRMIAPGNLFLLSFLDTDFGRLGREIRRAIFGLPWWRSG